MGIDATGSGEFSASAALHADPTVQSATRVEYPDRVFGLARFRINWLAPMPLGSDRQPDTIRIKVQHSDLGSRQRATVLDEDAGLTRTRGPERIQPENCDMEPARSRWTGILQVKEFSTGKGIKPPIEARFLQVKEKRHTASKQAPQRALAFANHLAHFHAGGLHPVCRDRLKRKILVSIRLPTNHPAICN